MAINYLKNYYEILGIKQDAAIDEIKEAYKASALKYHPDKNKNSNATDIFRDIQDAYEVLKNEETRADYNANYQHPSFALFKEFVSSDISIIKVKDYLNQGASIDACNAFNQTILMYAANRFKFEMVEALIKLNASVNMVDGSGNTPLMYAAMKENIHFSIDNAAIIKARNQKHFEEPKEETEDNKQTLGQEEQIDITKAPIMEVSLSPNILQSLWEAARTSWALYGTMIAMIYTLRGMPLKYQLPIGTAGVFFIHYELFTELIPSISSAIYYSVSGYNIKFHSNINYEEQREGIKTDQEIISSVYNFIFGKDGQNKSNSNTHEEKPNKQDERTKQINREKAKIVELLIQNKADPNLANNYGKTTLSYAAEFDNIQVMNFFYKLFEMDDKIIPEEDDNADIGAPLTSTEIVSYEYIVEISKTSTKGIALIGDNTEQTAKQKLETLLSGYISGIADLVYLAIKKEFGCESSNIIEKVIQDDSCKDIRILCKQLSKLCECDFVERHALEHIIPVSILPDITLFKDMTTARDIEGSYKEESRDCDSIDTSDSNNIRDWLKHVTDLLYTNTNGDQLNNCVYGENPIRDTARESYSFCTEKDKQLFEHYSLLLNHLFCVDRYSKETAYDILDIHSNMEKYILDLDEIQKSTPIKRPEEYYNQRFDATISNAQIHPSNHYGAQISSSYVLSEEISSWPLIKDTIVSKENIYSNFFDNEHFLEYRQQIIDLFADNKHYLLEVQKLLSESSSSPNIGNQLKLLYQESKQALEDSNINIAGNDDSYEVSSQLTSINSAIESAIGTDALSLATKASSISYPAFNEIILGTQPKDLIAADIFGARLSPHEPTVGTEKIMSPDGAYLDDPKTLPKEESDKKEKEPCNTVDAALFPAMHRAASVHASTRDMQLISKHSNEELLNCFDELYPYQRTGIVYEHKDPLFAPTHPEKTITHECIDHIFGDSSKNNLAKHALKNKETYTEVALYLTYLCECDFIKLCNNFQNPPAIDIESSMEDTANQEEFHHIPVEDLDEVTLGEKHTPEPQPEYTPMDCFTTEHAHYCKVAGTMGWYAGIGLN